MKILQSILAVSLFVTGFLLAGCGSLLTSDRPAASTWWLEPLGTGPGLADAAPALQFTLQVVPGLDTDRILTLDGDARLNHYAGARWPDGLPEVLRSVMRRSLASSGRFSTVSGSGARGETCQLAVEIHEFFARVDAGGVTRAVRVALEATFDCGAGARTLPVSETVTVSAHNMRSIVAAFQSALDRATNVLIGQLQVAQS